MGVARDNRYAFLVVVAAERLRAGSASALFRFFAGFQNGRDNARKTLLDFRAAQRVDHFRATPLGADDAGFAEHLEMVRLGRFREIGGRGGLDPVRYGDWEKNGRCVDF